MSGKDEYKDIFERPHHVSSKHPQMSWLNRAAQFSPFAALTGYGESIEEAARVTDDQLELGEDDLAVINERLRYLHDNIEGKQEVEIIYFRHDDRKSGGEYIQYHGLVSKVRIFECELVTASGLEIPFSDIYSISGKLFETFDGI